MKKRGALAALAALAQDNRLDVFRLLVQAGPEGMPAFAVADALDLAPHNLTFHLDRLREARGAGVVSAGRDGRSMVYSARFDAMKVVAAFLSDICCAQSKRQRTAPAHA